MTCCTADPARATLGSADPRKHVNYVLGMVLGVDDLTQEFAYLDNRVRSAARELLGYGTDRGLAVSLEATERGPRARITTGVAYSPSGQMICVVGDQCCALNDWLSANAVKITERFGAAPAANLRLAITLCYRECLTDKAPIPGDPCRSEDALTAPSRIKDEFTLELRFAPPPQTEEDAVRELVRWLKAVPVRAESPPDSVEDLVAALRAAASPWLNLGSPPDTTSSPPSSPPGLWLGDPPPGLSIPPGDCAEYLRAAFLVWVTELRPAWIARFGGCHADGCDCADCADDCVLLAELDIPILPLSPGGWVASDVLPVRIDESRRPYLLHMRMLQEWLLASCQCVGEAAPAPGPAPIPSPFMLPDLGGDLSGPIDGGVIQKIQGVDVVATGANNTQVLTFLGGAWRPANAPVIPVVPTDVFGDVEGPFASTVLKRIHTTPVADQPPIEGQFMGFNGVEWIPTTIDIPDQPIPPLAGDVTGSIDNNMVVGLQAFPVVPPDPVNDVGSTLVFTGGSWVLQPAAAPAPSGKFVQFPRAENGYAIVAAGRFGFEANDGVINVSTIAYDPPRPERTFGHLACIGWDRTIDLPWRVFFTFAQYRSRLEKGVLLVKATAGFLPEQPAFQRKFPVRGTRRPFQVMFCDYAEEGFSLLIPQDVVKSSKDNGQDDNGDKSYDTLDAITAGEIQIEVSWYPGDEPDDRPGDNK